MLVGRFAFLDLRADAVVGERDLRDQDHVGSAGNPRVQSDPARIAAHDLQHHDAVVAFRRGVQAVQGIGGAGHRRVEAEGHHGPFEIVVDGLGHAHQGHASLEQLLADAQRSVAANADQAADVQLLHARLHAVDQLLGQTARFAVPDFRGKTAAIRRTQNRPATRQQRAEL